MNKLVLEEIEHQLTIISGQLSLVEAGDNMFLKMAQAELIGVIHGIRNIVDHMPPSKPFPKPTTDELETRL